MSELAARPTVSTAVSGEVLDPRGLAARAAEGRRPLRDGSRPARRPALAARVAPHVLRAPRRCGADVGTISELAGHADIRTTTIYTAVSPDRLEDAIAERSRRRNAFRTAAVDAPL
jgi:integrase